MFLQNTVPQTPAGLSVEQSACLIKDQAKMMSAVACAQVKFKPSVLKVQYFSDYEFALEKLKLI